MQAKKKKYVSYNITYNIITHDVSYKNCYPYFLLPYSFSVHLLFYFSPEACILPST